MDKNNQSRILSSEERAELMRENNSFETKAMAERGLLLPYFERVQNPADWKAPIDAYCRVADKELTARAIAFFTATEASFEPTEKPNWVHVKAIGYRRGPAGDH